MRDSVEAALAIMEPQVNARHVRVTTSLPVDPVRVEADPVRLEQVIVNLVRNALDALNGQDKAEIDLLLTEGDTVTLTVRDNGPGIADLDSLFEPFYTTKPPGEGVGLGLAISTSIAKDFGGRLTARNGAECGAVFEMQLPPGAPIGLRGCGVGRQGSNDDVRTGANRDRRRRTGHAPVDQPVAGAVGLRDRDLRLRRGCAEGHRRRLSRHRGHRHQDAGAWTGCSFSSG
jgi:hypothetical protein